MYTREQNVYVVAVTRANANAMLAFTVRIKINPTQILPRHSCVGTLGTLRLGWHVGDASTIYSSAVDVTECQSLDAVGGRGRGGGAEGAAVRHRDAGRRRRCHQR